MILFIITVFEAIITLVLAFLIFKSGKRKFMNQTFSLFLIFMSLWILAGFPHALQSNPSNSFITLEWRFANLAANLGSGIFCLFAFGFLKGKKPNRYILWSVSLPAVFLAVSSMTRLVVKQASYTDGKFFVIGGPLYAATPVYCAIVGGIGLACLWIKRKHSRGTDRARANYLLLGFSFILIIGILFNYALPTIMGEDVTSAFSFPLVIIPILFTGYAMLRHRLLDVKVAMRKSLAYFLTLILFGAPLIVLYALMRTEFKVSRNFEITISIGILALVVFLSPIVLRWSSKLSSRLFFSGLYDEVELLHKTSMIFSSTVDMKVGLVDSASLISEKLNLEKILIAIPGNITQQEGNWLLGTMRHGGRTEGVQETNVRESPLYDVWALATIDDEPSDGDDEKSRVLAEMREEGIEACIPIKGPAGKLGVLLVGEKLNQGNLDPLDLDFLNHFADQAGLFIENYLLSTYLLGQLEELLRIRTELQKADQFKTDIINVTSHELRTPLTVLNSFTQILLERYERCTESQRIEYLGYVEESCNRLNLILNQFLTVSNLQEAHIEILPRIISINDVFNNVRSSFEPTDHLRINLEVAPNSLAVRADPLYLPLMLKNLVENAIRFSSPEFPVVMSAWENGDKVIISVSDSGEGIDAPDVQRIFSPFARLEEMDQHHTGTGLGLYLVRLIAELLGTSVAVESQLNQGSLFQFSLPLAVLEEQQEHEHP